METLEVCELLDGFTISRTSCVRPIVISGFRSFLSGEEVFVKAQERGRLPKFGDEHPRFPGYYFHGIASSERRDNTYRFDLEYTRDEKEPSE
jgi:hypothetical protein